MVAGWLIVMVVDFRVKDVLVLLLFDAQVRRRGCVDHA